MDPPAEPLRTELNEALVRGIRRHGPDAVGLVIIGIARIAIAFAALMALLLAGAVFGLDLNISRIAGFAGVSGLAGWLVVREPRRREPSRGTEVRREDSRDRRGSDTARRG